MRRPMSSPLMPQDGSERSEAPAAPAAPAQAAPLRRGWSTGACALGASVAAYLGWVSGEFPDPVTVTLPRGEQPRFPLAEQGHDGESAWVAILKDAGDDPDVTHGALIRVRLWQGEAGSGIGFRAGEGVGTVTRPGLPVAVGEPAINPVPRRLITAALTRQAAETGGPADLVVEIAIPGGEALARQTLNPRLGIEGGLSILGTTGVVVPYSCSAWIASLQRGVDVARACGAEQVVAVTGATSEATARRLLPELPDYCFLEMGDFVGALLKYLRRHPVPRFTLVGGFAKLVKLAQGADDLHSGRSRIDFADLAARVPGLPAEAATAPTALQVLSLAEAAGLPLAPTIVETARAQILQRLQGTQTEVAVIAVARDGRVLAGIGGGAIIR